MIILNTIYEFSNKDSKTTNGLYHVQIDGGNKYYFLRNNNSVGAIQHLFNRPASECIGLIRDDVKQKFFELLNVKESHETR
jgi:hypothetical protein